jgi:ferrous iron transport protein B
LRQAHRDAEQIMRAYVKPPLRPDTWTGKLDGILLHPVRDRHPDAILFLMFQAVSAGPRR